MSEHHPTQRGTDLLVRAVSYVAAALLFSMMAIVVADVVFRYLFEAPIRGTFEVVGFLLGVMVFSGIVVASRRNEHINVSILDYLFTGTVRYVQQAFVLLLSSVVLGFIAYRLFAAAERMRQRELLALSFDFPVAPVVYVMAILAAVASLMVAQLLLRHLRSPRDLSQDSDATWD
jgi:TRAP-type C4-dicarboxylate transport system permease small subunit